MWMLARILGRLLKSAARVLLIGWTPPPPPDFEARLDAVEKLAERTRQKVYRDGKAEEAAADNPLATIALQEAQAAQTYPAVLGAPVHSDGTPVRHGDHPR